MKYIKEIKVLWWNYQQKKFLHKKRVVQKIFLLRWNIKKTAEYLLHPQPLLASKDLELEEIKKIFDT